MKKNNKTRHKSQFNKSYVYLDLTNPNKSVYQAIEDLKEELNIVSEAKDEVAKEVVIEITEAPKSKLSWYKRLWKTIRSIF